MFILSAQELKQGGISALKKLLKKDQEVLIQERGKDTCVVLDVEHYNQLRLCELEVAYLKAQEDIKTGRYEVIEDIKKHVQQVLEKNEEDL